MEADRAAAQKLADRMATPPEQSSPLLPARVRRSDDDLQRDRAEEALIRRAAGAGFGNSPARSRGTPSPAARQHARSTPSSACRTSSAPVGTELGQRQRSPEGYTRTRSPPPRSTDEALAELRQLRAEAGGLSPVAAHHKVVSGTSPPPRRAESPTPPNDNALAELERQLKADAGGRSGGELFDRHHTPPAAAAKPPPRVAEMAHATNNISANLHDVLKIEKEQIRGITVVSLLSGFGRLFADGGQAARDDPHGTFAHSHPVEALDWFVSHSWRSPRAVKLLGLLLHFNRRDAATACAFATMLVCVAETLYFESLPPWLKFTGPNTFTDFSEIELGKGCAVVGYVTLTFFLFGAHVVRQALGAKPVECFLDVACIPQADPAAKQRGIASLGALLDRSERMLILLDKEYFTRLWCIFELAAFAKRAGMHRLEIVQLHSALTEWSVFLLMMLANVHSLIFTPFSDDGAIVGNVGLASIIVPMMIPQLRATVWANESADAVERLRNFSLDDAQCQGAEDRAAILDLIAKWYTDTSVELPPDERVRLGHHRFEQFVRQDVRLAVEKQHVRTRFSTTTVVMTLFAMCAPMLDVIASPDLDLYDCVTMATNVALFVGVGFPLWAIGLLFSSRVISALDRGGIHSVVARYSIGTLCMLIGTAINLAVCGVLTMPAQALLGLDDDVGSGWLPAGDGLDAMQRKQLKLQALFLVAVGLGLRL